jgi:methionyl-tRNA formyltransferase
MAVQPLQALVEAGHDIAICITRPDTRRGRGSATTPSPVKAAAQALGVAVSHDMEDVAASGVELGVVVAYGRIIPLSLLERVPMVNLHFSLLPRWRGAAPVERALLAGDAETGICVMAVEEGLDTGAVYARRTVPIGPETDLPSLRATLVDVGSALLVETLVGGRDGLPEPEPQAGEPTLAAKLSPSDLELHWQESAAQLDRVVRVGRAWTTFRGKRLGVVRAQPEDTTVANAPGALEGTLVSTGNGALRLLEVQPESRAVMAAADWARGARPAVEERLGSG